MKVYLLSLAAGVLVGIIYSLLNVRSPAPPLVALVGLLGILIGEQAMPVAKRLTAADSLSSAGEATRCAVHIFGEQAGRHAELKSNPPSRIKSNTELE